MTNRRAMFPTTARPARGSPEWTASLSPLAYVKTVVLSPGAPYTSSERLVALAIADRLNLATDTWSMSYADIAERTGLSTDTVYRARKLWSHGEPHQLFAHRFDHERRCYYYRLLRRAGVIEAAMVRSRVSKRSRAFDDAEPDVERDEAGASSSQAPLNPVPTKRETGVAA